MFRALLIGSALLALLAAPASAQLAGPTLPANDFESNLSLLGDGQDIAGGPVQMVPHPALVPVPKAKCGPGSKPLNDPIQGRVSQEDVDSPQAVDGWTCNLTQRGS